MTRRSPRNLSDLTNEERSLFAEILRERIYATITLLAVVVVLWQHPDEHQPLGTIGIMFGTVAALWLATLIATRMSYTVIHGAADVEPKYLEAKKVASGLFAPVALPIVLVLVSMTGVFTLKTALFVGMVSLVLSLFFFSVASGRRVADNTLHLLLYSVLQMALGIAIVLLKLAVE